MFDGALFFARAVVCLFFLFYVRFLYEYEYTTGRWAVPFAVHVQVSFMVMIGYPDALPL